MMDVQYRRLRAPTLARKCDFLRWFPCGADGLVNVRSRDSLSWIDRYIVITLVHFLAHLYRSIFLFFFLISS